MTNTKTREPLVLPPLEDEPATENLPEPIPLTREQTAAQAEADERDRQRQLEWALVVQALNDNSLAVVRAMRRLRSETEQEQVERVLTSYEDGSFPPGLRYRHSFHSGMKGAMSRWCGSAQRPGAARQSGLILGFGLWRGLMLDGLPVLGQPLPSPLNQIQGNPKCATLSGLGHKEGVKSRHNFGR